MADTGWSVRVFTSFVVFLVYLPCIVWSKSFQCPSACTCLGSLVDCSKRGLTSVPDDIPTWVVILDLSTNKLANVDLLTSQNLTNLDELDLSNNEIESLNETLIVALPALRELKLNFNRLKEIPLFPRVASITSMSLQHNQIDDITPQPLTNLPKLRHLDLGFNQIRQLRADMFSLHPFLHQLYLNNNLIRKVDKGALKNLPSLSWLKLNKNKIRRLPKEVFANLTKLQDLELSRNRLQVVESLTFQGLTSLVTLRLDRNKISELMDGAFFGPGNIHNLILDHNNITAITKGWLYGLERLEVLNLSHNYVSHVEDEVWTCCKLLSKLDLRENDLRIVNESTFTELSSLQHLVLDNNHMIYLASGAFQDLGSLEVLELNNNNISWTIEDMSGTFEGLGGLRRLSLRNNQIKLIAKRAFDGLDHLQQLNLENNLLTSVQMNAFDVMGSLEELYFNTTQLVCDCQLSWLPRWLSAEGLQHMVTAKCVYPEQFHGLSIFDVVAEEMTCAIDESPKPVIMVQPDSQAALMGSNTSVECVAHSSDSSALTVQWRKDSILIKNGRVETYERSPEEGLWQVRSVLMIGDVQDENGGVYQCVVSNSLGTAYSVKAEITVNILPHFLNTPDNVRATAGTTARLDCKANGHPSPSIAWKKDGGDNFPAARERRLVMPTDDVLFITKVRPEDEGVYSCTAKNNVGIVVANATLRVFKKPVFEKEFVDKEVEVGATALLECKASGTPEPEILWLKNGQPIQPTERHYFAGDKQFLIISRSNETDAGLYTCRVSNTLAAIEGHSKLTVTSGGINLMTSVETQGQSSSTDTDGSNGIFGEDSMMTGIIIIAVVCCVVGTSLIWVIIIYKTRKRTEEYSSTPTDETTLPGDMPSTPYHGSDRDSNSPGLFVATSSPNGFTKCSMMENGGFGYSPAKVRMAAIFPSDIGDDHLRQSIPLTSDEQQPAESSDTSIALLRRLRHSTDSDTTHSTPSPHHSVHSLHSNRSAILHTFQPHLAPSSSHHCHHQVPMSTCDVCNGHSTVALVHSSARCGSCPRLDVIVSEDEPEVQKSADEREVTHRRSPDDYHGSQPPGTYSDPESESTRYSTTFPPTYCRQRDNRHQQHTYPTSEPHYRQVDSSSPDDRALYSLPPPPSRSYIDPSVSTPYSDFHTVVVTQPNASASGQPITSLAHTQQSQFPRLTNGHIPVTRTVSKLGSQDVPHGTVQGAVSYGDSCTDSESCQEEDGDVFSAPPHVVVIPNCYPSSVGSASDVASKRDSVLNGKSRNS